MTTARSDQYLISGTFNYRDVGGLRTAAGAKVASGVLLRSAHLCRLDADGHDTLAELGVTVVHDLRGPQEIRHLGADALPPEVRLRHTPFDSRLGEKPPHEVVHTDGRQEMLQVYREFPLMPEAHGAITSIATSIAGGTGAVLVHCAAGKDRTGWAIATLLRAAGVTETEILEDFLLSNNAIEPLRADVAVNSDGRVELPFDLLGVRDEYLAAATESMHEHHGDFENYLATIGITPELRERLQDRLLE